MRNKILFSKLFLLVVVSAIGYVFIFAQPNASMINDPTIDLDELEQKAIKLLNDERIKRNLKPLKRNEKLAMLARTHSKDMAQHGFVGLKGKDGRTIKEQAKALNIKGWSNLGRMVSAYQGSEKPLEETLKRWIDSIEHSRYMFEYPWVEVGVGIAVTKEKTYYITQDFLER